MSDTLIPAATDRKPSRAVALAVAGVVGASLFTASRAYAQSKTYTFNDIPGSGDIKALNYALALEDLESALYLQCLDKLKALGISSGILFDYTSEFTTVEVDHAAFLRGAITSAGGSGAAIPVGTYAFGLDKITDARGVLEFLLQVEATGVRAYLGAIPFFTTKSAYLQTAAAIQATEARHTSVLTIVRNILYPGTNVDVAPLSGDTTINDAAYNTAVPNQGNKGIDVTLSPDVVLAGVSPFIVKIGP